jgi:hypothetical protein
MISKLDTLTFTNNKVVLDISEWQTLSVQVIGGSGTISLLATNDDGAITGSTSGNAGDAANFNAVQATNLTSGATATAVTGTNLFRIDPISFKYLQIGDGSTAVATKILVFKTKPY